MARKATQENPSFWMGMDGRPHTRMPFDPNRAAAIPDDAYLGRSSVGGKSSTSSRERSRVRQQRGVVDLPTTSRNEKPPREVFLDGLRLLLSEHVHMYEGNEIAFAVTQSWGSANKVNFIDLGEKLAIDGDDIHTVVLKLPAQTLPLTFSVADAKRIIVTGGNRGEVLRPDGSIVLEQGARIGELSETTRGNGGDERQPRQAKVEIAVKETIVTESALVSPGAGSDAAVPDQSSGTVLPGSKRDGYRGPTYTSRGAGFAPMVVPNGRSGDNGNKGNGLHIYPAAFSEMLGGIDLGEVLASRDTNPASIDDLARIAEKLGESGSQRAFVDAMAASLRTEPAWKNVRPDMQTTSGSRDGDPASLLVQVLERQAWTPDRPLTEGLDGLPADVRITLINRRAHRAARGIDTTTMAGFGVAVPVENHGEPEESVPASVNNTSVAPRGVVVSFQEGRGEHRQDPDGVFRPTVLPREKLPPPFQQWGS